METYCAACSRPVPGPAEFPVVPGLFGNHLFRAYDGEICLEMSLCNAHAATYSEFKVQLPDLSDSLSDYEWTKVYSKALYAYCWLPDHRVLGVILKETNMVYFHDISDETFQKFVASRSQGSFWGREITRGADGKMVAHLKRIEATKEEIKDVLDDN